jgi:tetratricopeptide (TPR) repeat protein
MSRAVILTSHSDGYQAVRAHLTGLKEETHPQGTIYELGQFFENEQTWEVAIAEIDNSNAIAAWETERAISHFQPDVILLVSAATGIKDVSLGDIVIANKIYSYESGRAEHEFLPQPVVPEPSPKLRERAKAERKKVDWLSRLPVTTSTSTASVLLAPIASGAKEVVDSQITLLKFLRAEYGDAVAVDNLGFGFLKAAQSNENVCALAIYGISHLITDDLETIQKSYRTISLQSASAFAFEILSKYKANFSGTTERIRGVVVSTNSNEMIAEMLQRFESKESSGLTNERYKRIDYARSLINQGEYSQAIKYIEELKTELWYQVDSIFKYRLLANLGMSRLGLDEINEAASSFVEALQYNPEDDKAIVYAAMGYMFQKDYSNAERLIEKALQKNPANALAYSLRIRIAPLKNSIQSLLEQIPAAYHESLDVIVALGEAALNRGLYSKAEECFQIALQSDNSIGMDSIKATLGVVLMELVVQNYSLIAAGQLSDSQKFSLERAINLFGEILGGNYIDTKKISRLGFIALTNRASALRLLGQYDDSIRDINMALEQEPENSYLIKQRALLAHEKGNEVEAYSYAQKILLSPDTPEASLLAAASLMALKRFQEAENILNEFLQTDSPDDLKRQAKCIKFNLFLECNDRQNAEETLQQIINEDPESIFTYIQRIHWRKYISMEEDVPCLVEEAKVAFIAKSCTFTQIIFADALFSWGYYRDAAEIYEQFVDKNLNSPLSRRLLQSYYFEGNYKDALNLCKLLLDKYGPLEMVSEMAAYIHGAIGDMVVAKQICQTYLNVFPYDIVVQLRLALAHYAIGEYEKLDEFLDSELSIEGLNLTHLKCIALLYKCREKVDRFLELVYEIRHRFYGDGQIHVFYQISYFEASKVLPIHNFEVVQDGCGVLLSNQVGHEQLYILEDRSDSVFAQFELSSSDSLYKALIGKSFSDEIVQIEDSFGCNTLKILAITDKYCAAAKQSFLILENQTGIKGYRSFAGPMDEDVTSSDWFQKIIQGLQKLQNQFDDIKAEYSLGKLPFGAFATLIARNPIELWQILAFEHEPFINTWTNSQYENFENALTNLQKGGLVVIDPISLMTLHYLEVADDVVRLLGKFGIAQSTVDLFQSVVEISQGQQCEGSLSLGVVQGQAVFHETSPEIISQQQGFFKKILTWIRENCLVLPCYKALDVNQDDRDKIRDFVGPAFVDTAMIAGEPGRILYSDDQLLRLYAQADSGVSGVWTQNVLKYCLVQRTSNESLYRKAVLGLASRGYTHTIMDAETLLEAAKIAKFKVQPIYTDALRALASEYTFQEYAILVSANFLRQLYLEVVIADCQSIDPYDGLVFELLKVLTAKRSAKNFIDYLKQAIHRTFKVIPLQERQVLLVIHAWEVSQTIIT